MDGVDVATRSADWRKRSPFIFVRPHVHALSSWKIRIAHIWKICKTLDINYVYMHWLTASMVVVAPTALNCLAATCLGALGEGFRRY